VIGALAALQQRHVTGRGCVIDTSLFETAANWVSGALNGYHLTGKVPERHGTASPLLVPYQIFDTADLPICIAAGNDRLFVKCAAALGHPEWASDPRFEDGRKRVVHRAALIAAIEAVLRGGRRDDWIAALEKAGVPCAPVNDIADLARSEQMQAVDLMRTLPGSGMKVVGLPISFDRQRPHPRSDSPRLGEHNAEVLGEKA
jgi:formyl-CoA transferase